MSVENDSMALNYGREGVTYAQMCGFGMLWAAHVKHLHVVSLSQCEVLFWGYGFFVHICSSAFYDFGCAFTFPAAVVKYSSQNNFWMAGSLQVGSHGGRRWRQLVMVCAQSGAKSRMLQLSSLYTGQDQVSTHSQDIPRANLSTTSRTCLEIVS